MSSLQLPATLTQSFLRQLPKVVIKEEKSDKNNSEPADHERLLNDYVPLATEEYPQEFVYAFMLVKLNSLARQESPVGPQFLRQMAQMLNDRKQVHIKISKSDPSFMAQVILEGNLSKWLSLATLQNILQGNCLFATTFALLLESCHLFLKRQEIAFALSFVSLGGRPQAFIPILHKQKNHKGQLYFAERVRELIPFEQKCQTKERKVQDPYSMRCAPQVHGVVYDTLEDCQNSLGKLLNKFHFQTLLIDGLQLPNLDLRSDGMTLKYQFLLCCLSQVGSMGYLRSQRMLNSYLGKNSLKKHQHPLYNGLWVLLQDSISCLNDNKLLCAPTADTMNIDNYQQDIYYAGGQPYDKMRSILKNLNQIQCLQVMASVAVLTQCPEKQIQLQNTQMQQHLQRLQHNIKFENKKHSLQFVTDKWMAKEEEKEGVKV